MRAVNLIPGEQRSGTSVGAGRSEGAAYAVLALVAGLAVMALFYGLARNEVAGQRAQAATAAAKAQQAVAAAERLAPYTSFVAQREQRADAVASIVNTRFDWAHVFHEIGRVLPLQTSINSLTGTVGSTGGSGSSSSSSSSASSSASHASASTAGAGSGASVSSATPTGTVPTFTLAGCATSQPAVALMLERLRLIDGVSEVTLQSSTASSGSGGGGGGGGSGAGCPEHDPAFTVAVTFDPLPSASAVASATKTTSVSDAASAGTKAAPATTPGGPK